MSSEKQEFVSLDIPQNHKKKQHQDQNRNFWNQVSLILNGFAIV